MKHYSTHTLDKPIACMYCPYRTIQNYHLKRHISRIHPDKISETGKDETENNMAIKTAMISQQFSESTQYSGFPENYNV